MIIWTQTTQNNNPSSSTTPPIPITHPTRRADALNGVPIAGQAHFKNGKRELSRPHATTNDPNGWESTEWGKQRDQVGGCEHNTPERLDFIYENDVAVGQLLNYLETHDDPRNPGHKLIDNTLFIFSSDNGAENAGKESSGYYRGRKAHIHEGGHRVPTIAFWKQGNIGDGNDATPGAHQPHHVWTQRPHLIYRRPRRHRDILTRGICRRQHQHRALSHWPERRRI